MRYAIRITYIKFYRDSVEKISYGIWSEHEFSFVSEGQYDTYMYFALDDTI